MCASDSNLTHKTLAQMMQDFDDCASVGNLIIKDNNIFTINITHNGVDYDLFIAYTLFVSCCHWQFQQSCKLRSRLGVTKIGRDHNGLAKIPIAEVACQDFERIQVVHGHTEEAMHLL